MDVPTEKLDELLESIRESHPELYAATVTLHESERYWRNRVTKREEATQAIPTGSIQAERTATVASGQCWRAVGVCSDVTERTLAEEALRESEKRFRTLVNDLPNLVWILNSNSQTELVNRAWLEFTGCTEDEALTFDWRTAVHPDDSAQATASFQSAYEARSPYQNLYRMRRRDGQYRWLFNSAVPRHFPDGTFVGYLGSSLDVTEQKLLQEQLRDAQRLESLGRLAGGVAHDFNNLLTAIMGYTELALSDLPADGFEASLLKNILTASERAAHLTQQLLMYARRQMVEFSTFDINQIILNMDSLLESTIGEQYELVLQLTQDACYVQSNSSQIEQVLTNLVINARDSLHYCKSGRILLETAVVVLDQDYAANHVGVKPGEYVMFAVSDNGAGMAPEVKERIFEPFFSTKGKDPNNGLGLATCYGIVKQSKGNIWVYSEPGAGTTFKVYLPRVHVTDDTIIASSILPDRPLAGGNETLLLVDDEPMVRDATARILREQGYQVLEASNGGEALHLGNAWPDTIHLLLTDVIMPSMGGKELANRLSEIRPDTKVLFMSGFTQDTIVQSGVLDPSVHLLTKPFSSASLINKVREALEKH